MHNLIKPPPMGEKEKEGVISFSTASERPGEYLNLPKRWPELAKDRTVKGKTPSLSRGGKKGGREDAEGGPLYEKRLPLSYQGDRKLGSLNQKQGEVRSDAG